MNLERFGAQQLLLDLSSGNPTLANFVAGGNAEVLQMLKDLLARRLDEGMIYLWGEAGCGKSHLLLACMEEARKSGIESIHVSCRAGVRFDLDADFVAVDDVENLDDEGQIGLFHLYNRLRERGGMLLASGNVPPAGAALRADLSTRLGWGLVYQVHALCDEEKRDAIKAHARARGFEISVEVVDYLMHHIRRDLATLVKMLDALDEYSRREKRPITIPMLKEIMRQDGKTQCV
ncbi:MAG: DnaA regulatory inactivator Hda [Burkholderiales bacterium]|nr:DnaA regulatory inactivator Hda [Burkholderiales bacterium]